MGDYVELQSPPGETLPTVAQLQELWSETPADGQPRMLARVCRFYRAQVFPLSGSSCCSKQSLHSIARPVLAPPSETSLDGFPPPHHN